MKNIKSDFPIFSNHPRLVYLDNAATSQKPKIVIDSIVNFYENINASANRGVYDLSEAATEKYNAAKEKIARFIGAKDKEIVFTKNVTESFNILCHRILPLVSEGKNEIVLTEMEHHSNLVPWQQFAKLHNFELKYIPINKDYELDMKVAKELINEKTAIVSVTHVSNVFGTVNDVKTIVKLAKDVEALSIIDAAQSVIHMEVNVKEIDCDFLGFSSHKMLGPTGIGVLFGREELLEKMEPLFFGGGMVEDVNYENATWAELPDKFEAGTQNYCGAVALGVTIDYIKEIDFENMKNHEKGLVSYCLKKLNEVEGLKVYSPIAGKNAGVISFNVEGVHPHDVSSILNEFEIAIRGGHMCAIPLMKKLGVNGVCRASFTVYNSKEDIDKLIMGIKKVKEVFKK